LTFAVALSRDHLDQLSPAGNEFCQGFRLCVWNGSSLRAHPLSKQGDDASIELICFGALPRRSREIPDVPRVHHGHRQTSAGERRGDLYLEATARFEHDKSNREGRQMRSQGWNAVSVSRERQGCIGGPDMDVQAAFGNIDADEGWCGRRSVFHRDPSLQYGLEALTTVRVL
jgi:hypothetical protein